MYEVGAEFGGPGGPTKTLEGWAASESSRVFKGKEGRMQWRPAGNRVRRGSPTTPPNLSFGGVRPQPTQGLLADQGGEHLSLSPPDCPSAAGGCHWPNPTENQRTRNPWLRSDGGALGTEQGRAQPHNPEPHRLVSSEGPGGQHVLLERSVRSGTCFYTEKHCVTLRRERNTGP